MAIRDYWIEQRRDVDEPWTLYIVVEYDAGSGEMLCVDYTFYHADIPNKHHMVSDIGLHHKTPAGYARELADIMGAYVDIESSDKWQLLGELTRMLSDANVKGTLQG